MITNRMRTKSKIKYQILYPVYKKISNPLSCFLYKKIEKAWAMFFARRGRENMARGMPRLPKLSSSLYVNGFILMDLF